MQSSVEHLEGLAHKLTVEVPSARLDQEVAKRLKEITPRVRIDGFRPGKVPPAVVKQKYGASVRQDVLGEVIEETYREAIQQSGYEPVASPQIELVSGMAPTNRSNTPPFLKSCPKLKSRVWIKSASPCRVAKCATKTWIT